MAEIYAIGRPYARAVFEIAKADNDFSRWSDVLGFLSQVADDEAMQTMANHPQVDRNAIADLIIELGGEKLHGEPSNLVRLLVANNRLATLPAIAAQYEILRAEAEQIIEAEMHSARPVDQTQQDKVAAALEKRFGRKVKLTIIEDESLLGGAVIRAGDLVIDGSAKGRLQKLSTNLLH